MAAYNLYAAVHFYIALGNDALAAKMEMVCDENLNSKFTLYYVAVGTLLIFSFKAAGACNFVLCIPIWYIFVAQMLESIDFPLVLPVGDLSELIQGRNQKAQKRTENEA